MTDDPRTACASMLAVYSERSARDKLARHRRRGEQRVMWACGDHWHVTEVKP